MIQKVSKTPQRKPIQRRSQQTRDAILKASAQILLSKSGLAGLNSNAIAQKAGVSIGSFYQYYANKEAVLSDLIQNRMDHLKNTMGNGLAEVAADLEADPRTLLKTLLGALIQEFKRDQLLALLMFQYAHVIADQNRMEKVDADLIPAVAQIIQQLIPNGRKKNLEVAVYVLLQSYRGVLAISSMRRFKGLGTDELTEEMTDLFWRYLN